MRLAFVSIPRFPCAVEISRRPELQQRPLIVGDTGQSKRVLDRSPEAAQRGVRSQMTMRKAMGLCPEAIVVPPDPVLYRHVWDEALSALDLISPEIEHTELGRAYINVSGLLSHYNDERDLAGSIVETVRLATGLGASVGIASGKLPAVAAASTAGPGDAFVVPAGAEGDFLAPASVDLLPVEEEVLQRLKLLGLYELGDVARLTVPELQSQFGFQGERLWQLAHGIDTERLVPRPHRESLAVMFSFEAPVAGIDVMLAVGKQLLSRLLPALGGKAARRLVLQAELVSGRGWEQQVVMREAVSEEARLLFILRSALNNFPPPQAIRSLTLKLDGLTGEKGQQLSLGERGRLQRQLEEAINQLKARYGYSPVYRCVDVEPWSVVPEERQILVESDG